MGSAQRRRVRAVAYRRTRGGATCRAPGLTLAAVSLALGAGCGDCGGEEEFHGLPETTSTHQERPEMAQRCELGEQVVSPEKGSPEWVVAQLLQTADEAGTKGEAETAFQTFYGFFGPGQKESWVRRQYWKDARQRVDIFLAGDDAEHVYTICRRKSSGDDRVKLYVKSHSMDKSHVPITLQKNDEGKWRVSSFSI